MVRYEDPPGATKHLRFGHYDTRNWLVQALTDFGAKAIVAHKCGKRGEHPHLHVWWEGESVTNQTIRNRLKKDDRFNVMKTQNDWSFRNHDSYDNWCDYVTRNKSHEVLLGNDALRTLSSSRDVTYDEPERAVSDNVIVEEKEKKKDDSWNRIRCAFLDIDDRASYSISAIRKFICALWLRKGQPIPRGADLDRWAKSLWILTRFEGREEEITAEDCSLISQV